MNNKNKGIFLLESLIYISILAFMLVFVLNTIFLMSKSFALNKLSSDINSSAMTALDIMTYEIKRSIDVSVENSILSSHPSKLVLNTTDINGLLTTVEFYIENNVLKMKEGGVEVGSIILNYLEVDNFVVDLINTTNSGGLRVSLTIKGSQGIHFRSETFYTASAIR